MRKKRKRPLSLGIMAAFGSRYKNEEDEAVHPWITAAFVSVDKGKEEEAINSWDKGRLWFSI